MRSGSRFDRSGPILGHREAWVPGLLALLSIAWLGGCATSADPHEGGFVNGLGGVLGGGYQRRIDERQQTYQGELDAQSRLHAQAQELERERAEVHSQLRSAQSRLAVQERRIAQQRARLASDPAGLRRLDRAQAQLASAKGQIKAAESGDRPVSDLKTRTADIQRELDNIDNLVGVVGSKSF
jgi:hypothetical protein